MSDSCSENTDFLVSLPSDFFQVHTSDSEAVEDTATEELSISSNSSFKGVINDLVSNLNTLSSQINEIEQMETSCISNGLASPLSASSPLKRNGERKINYSSIDSLMHEMVNTYEYNDKLLRNIGNGHTQRNANIQEKDVRSPAKIKEGISDGLNDNKLHSLCDDLDNINPHEPILNDTHKLDSVSKENLWLKLGKEIYRRQNIEKKVVDLEEKLINYEKKISECKEIDSQKNNLLDELAARSAMILSQVRTYSTMNEKLNRDLHGERKNKKDILDAMKEKIELYKCDSAKAVSRSNSYKARTESAEKRLNELMINCQKVEEQTKHMQLNVEQKNEEIERLQNELMKMQEKSRNVTERYNRTIDKCSELEKEVLILNQEKKVLCEKTLKYDQLLDQKRRIEEIVNQMKSTEIQTAEELNAAKEEIKTVKTELKSFYQKQLDAMMTEKVSDYQRKLDGIVQITNEENKLLKLQMNNQIVNYKERYEKDKAQINTKYKAEVDNLEKLLKDKSVYITSLEQRLEAEVLEKRQLVKSVMGVVKNVNIESQSNSKLSSDNKYKKNTSNMSNSSSRLEDDFSFFEQEKLLHQVTPTELRKHIEILLNKYPGNPLAQK